MQQGYLARSWAAVTSTPHWMGKISVLALVSLIPIFGQIVVAGYLWGWARDAAWGVDAPMPEHVFGNEDGHLYGRGFFAFAISIIASFIPSAVSWLAAGAFGLSTLVASDAVGQLPAIAGFGLVGALALGVAIFVLSVIIVPISWVATMRMSVYTTFSSAFSLPRIWAMVRRDPVGLVKIFAMDILLSVGVSFVLGAIFVLIFILGIFLMAAMAVPFADASSAAMAFVLMGAGFVVLAVLVGTAFASAFGFVLVQALVVRAVGYWTARFDVALWRGQSDPLPCEAVM